MSTPVGVVCLDMVPCQDAPRAQARLSRVARTSHLFPTHRTTMTLSEIETVLENALNKPGCLVKPLLLEICVASDLGKITYRLLSRKLSIHVGAAKR